VDYDLRDTWPLPFEGQAELEFTAGRGAVALVPIDPGAEAFLEVTGRGAAGVGVRVTRAGRVVRVDVRRDTGFRRSDERGETTVVLHVPRDIRAQLETEAGSMEARGLGPCALTIRTGAGRIALSDVYGRLRLSAGAGQIAGHGLGGSIDIQANAGAILLEIESLDPGEHRIYSGAGTIRLGIARDVDARVEVDHGRGPVEIDYPTRRHAAAVLRISSTNGSIYVREGHASGLRAPVRVPHEAPLSPPMPEGKRTTDADETPASKASDQDVERILELVAAGQLSARAAKGLLSALTRT
jgi:hypothetical protein